MNELDLVQLADNPDPRAPCLLLLDTSASMGGEPIRALNQGLQTLKSDLMKDELARRRVEIGIISFGSGGVNTVQPFVTASDWQPAPLSAGGSTPMGEALARGLEKINNRKELYRQAGLQYFRPWVFLLTDGEPTDSYEEHARQMQVADSARGLTFFVVGVERANLERLAVIAPQNRPPLKLQGLRFEELFLWLSQSQQRVSHSRVGDQLALPPVGWAEVSS